MLAKVVELSQPALSQQFMNKQAALAAEDFVFGGKGGVGAGFPAVKAIDSFLATLGGRRIKCAQEQRGHAATARF